RRPFRPRPPRRRRRCVLCQVRISGPASSSPVSFPEPVVGKRLVGATPAQYRPGRVHPGIGSRRGPSSATQLTCSWREGARAEKRCALYRFTSHELVSALARSVTLEVDGTAGATFDYLTRMPRFALQFPVSEIEALAARFGYPDDAQLLAIGAA